MEPPQQTEGGQMPLRTQNLLYGSLWKLLAKILGVALTNGNVVNVVPPKMAHTLG